MMLKYTYYCNAKKINTLILIIIFSVTLNFKAQNVHGRVVDSLIKLSETKTIADSVKIKLYGDIGWELLGNDINASKQYVLKALQLSKINKRPADEAQSESDLGSVYNRMAIYDTALIHYFNALLIRTNLKQVQKVAGIYSNIASVYMRQNKFKESLEINYKSLKIFEELKDEQKQALILGNIGNIYTELNKNTEAKVYFNKTIVIAKKIHADVTLSTVLMNIGGLYFDENKLDSALMCFEESRAILEKNNLAYNLAVVYNNIGKVFAYKKNNTVAIEFYKKSLAIRVQLNDNLGIALSNLNLSELFLTKNQPDSAIARALISEKILINLKSYIFLKQAYTYLSKAYELKDDFKKSNEFIKLYAQTIDSIFTTEHAEKLAEVNVLYQTEKKEKENLELTNKNIKNELEILESKNQRNLIFIVLTLLVAVFVIVFIRQKNKQKQFLVEEKLQQEKIKIETFFMAQEKERERISKDLHDGVAQTLGAAKLNLSSITPNQINESVYQNTIELIDESVNEIRTISHNLMPALLYKNGLIDALKEIAIKINASQKIKVEIDNDETINRFSDFIEINVFRIIQEWLNNVLKHAKATEVMIQLTKDEKELTVMIEDNGIGFNKEKLNQSKGNGWANIQSRLTIINGIVEIDSNENKGTNFFISVPI